MVKRDVHTVWIDLAGNAGTDGDSSAVFPWWSFTKTAIAICALKLVEDGRLELDEPLSGRPYTVRHLLKHRAGVPDYGPIAAYHEAVARNGAPWSRQKLLDAVASDQLSFDPGTGWSYSNVGYLFARELIEERSGREFADLVAQVICRRLGLSSVSLATTRAAFSTVHGKAAKEYDPGWVYHGCLISNASDAATLLNALFRGDMLRPDTREVMLATQLLGGPIAGRPWSTTGYALGLMSGEMLGVGRAIGHSGVGPFSVNAVYHFPDLPDPFTVACFTDGTDEGVAEAEAVRIAAA